MLTVSVVVPTHNRPRALERTICALREMEFPSELLEILVIDNGSEQAGARAVALHQGVRYVHYPDIGVAAARNRGAALAAGELLLFVDDDIVVGRANLRKHEETHAAHHPCLVSGHWEFDPALRARLGRTALGRYRLRYEDLYNTPDGVVRADRRGRVTPETLAAGNLSIRRSVFWDLDGFDERFPVGAEDQDLTWRARRAGCALIYDYDIRVIHNDQHPDLRALCQRQERGAIGTVCFYAKNPDAPVPPLIELNGPLRRGDRPGLVARKLSRTLLSRPLGIAVGHRVIRAIELIRQDGGWPLEAAYRALGGLYVFRGVRAGFRLTASDVWSRYQPVIRTRSVV